MLDFIELYRIHPGIYGRVYWTTRTGDVDKNQYMVGSLFFFLLLLLSLGCPLWSPLPSLSQLQIKTIDDRIADCNNIKGTLLLLNRFKVDNEEVHDSLQLKLLSFAERKSWHRFKIFTTESTLKEMTRKGTGLINPFRKI